jgi:hypothetical protein
MSADLYAVGTFEEFWPHYLRLHARPETQAMHAVATLSCIGLFGAAVVLRSPILAVCAPLVDYAIAQASHRLFEANRTTPWKNPLWHTLAELRMLGMVVRRVLASASGRPSPHGTRSGRDR